MRVDESHTLSLKRFWVLGAGHFGQIAIERITRKFPGAVITVVDKAPNQTLDDRYPIIKEEGISWLHNKLGKDPSVDFIIPAIPVHVAAQWIILCLLDDHEIHPLDVPDSLMSKMPNPIKGASGQIFVSHANFVCPENCPEPEKICTHTGEPRPLDLYSLLENLDLVDILPTVIRSYQLLPGVGGIYPVDMLNALDLARKRSNRPIMIGTACRCHGAVDFIRLVPRNRHGAPIRFK
jgi:hypothetical protein